MSQSSARARAFPGLTKSDAQRLSAFARAEAGLTINADKLDFFDQRVRRRLRRLGCDRFDLYLDFVEGPQGQEERRHLLEALTTHTTSFFRETGHFDFLQDTGFDALVAQGAGQEHPLVIWSAACSNGAELFSALIVAREYMARRQMVLRIEGYGTDVSRAILRQAAHAVYDVNEISGLSEDRRRAHLLRHRSGKPQFRVMPDLRQLCQWQMTNLTEDHPEGPTQADVIFLRNVLIYFDRATQKRVVAALTRRLRPGGYLFTGHAETIAAPPADLGQIDSCIYRRGPD